MKNKETIKLNIYDLIENAIKIYKPKYTVDEFNLINTTELKLHKIIYFLYGYIKTDDRLKDVVKIEPIFEAWKYGPVEINFRKNNRFEIELDSEFENVCDILYAIVFSYMNQDLTPMIDEVKGIGTPWWECNKNNKEVIPNEMIIEYFKEKYMDRDWIDEIVSTNTGEPFVKKETNMFKSILEKLLKGHDDCGDGYWTYDDSCITYEWPSESWEISNGGEVIFRFKDLGINEEEKLVLKEMFDKWEQERNDMIDKWYIEDEIG